MKLLPLPSDMEDLLTETHTPQPLFSTNPAPLAITLYASHALKYLS